MIVERFAVFGIAGNPRKSGNPRGVFRATVLAAFLRAQMN